MESTPGSTASTPSREKDLYLELRFRTIYCQGRVDYKEKWSKPLSDPSPEETRKTSTLDSVSILTKS